MTLPCSVASLSADAWPRPILLLFGPKVILDTFKCTSLGPGSEPRSLGSSMLSFVKVLAWVTSIRGSSIATGL